jgi:predicted nucleic acid-binding Zn ribbon protein
MVNDVGVLCMSLELKFTEKRKHMFNPNINKICHCGKEFVGYKTQIQCTSCKNKKAMEVNHRNHCNRCNRTSHQLALYPKTKEYLCSFCIRKIATELYYFKNYGEIKPTLTKTCPVCKHPFETKNSVKVYCCDECKNIRNNERSTEYAKKFLRNPNKTIKIKVCLQCQKPYAILANNQKFCSSKCRTNFNAVIKVVTK